MATTGGYCEVCNVDVKNLYEHRKSKKHARNLNKQETKTESDGVIKVDGNTEEIREESMEREVETTSRIQIIDGNTGKKESGALDKLLEIAFSEEMMPVTMSLLGGIAQKLNGGVNNEEAEGKFVTTVSGAKVRVHGDF